MRERARRGELTRTCRACAACGTGSTPTQDSAARKRSRASLASTLESSKALHTIYAMRQELAALWERSNDSREQLLARLQDWCHRAEASGIAPLQQFLAAAAKLRVAARTMSRNPRSRARCDTRGVSLILASAVTIRFQSCRVSARTCVT